jgi:hypothetical protein
MKLQIRDLCWGDPWTQARCQASYGIRFEIRERVMNQVVPIMGQALIQLLDDFQ